MGEQVGARICGGVARLGEQVGAGIKNEKVLDKTVKIM